MSKPKILVLRKMSSLEYVYNNASQDRELHESRKDQDMNNNLIESILKQENCEYDIVTRKQIAGWMVERYDYVFSAGGDGTAIAAAFFNYNKPQLNLKNDSRSRGSLCFSDIERAIRATIKGDFKIEEWTRQNVILNYDTFIGSALNEVTIGEDMDFSLLAKYEIQDSGKLNERQENSGLIIATGTGSTGWPSAFKPYPRTEKYLKFKAILPMAGSEEGQSDYFKITYKNHRGKFKLDGAKELLVDFPRNSILEVRISESPLRVIIPNGVEK